MPETIGGIPLHPLVVHAVVVLIPLAALGVIAIALVPKWRSRFGILVVAVTAFATAHGSDRHLNRGGRSKSESVRASSSRNTPSSVRPCSTPRSRC